MFSFSRCKVSEDMGLLYFNLRHPQRISGFSALGTCVDILIIMNMNAFKQENRIQWFYKLELQINFMITVGCIFRPGHSRGLNTLRI